MNEKESDIFSTIMAFEQILEVMPEDRSALETLARAYADMGDHARAKFFNMRLARVLIDEGEIDDAVKTAEALRPYADEDSDAAALIAEIDARARTRAAAPEEAPASRETAAATPESGTDGAVETGVNLAEEMAFAWNLLQSGGLTQEEYARTVQDLTELAAGNRAGSVSVLHILHDRGFKGFERLLVKVAREANVPLILLPLFEITRDASDILPLDFIVHRVALPFEIIGNEIMVALLNPYDMKLRKDTQELAGRRCHWFLATPAGFDQAVGRIREMLVG